MTNTKWTDNAKFGVSSRYDTVYCDIDGTLLLWPEKPGSGNHARKNNFDPVINQDIVHLLYQYKRQGAFIVLWSMGGADHCRYAAEFCGIDHIVDEYLQKPTVVMDDSPCWHLRRKCYDQAGKLLTIPKELFRKIRKLITEGS